MSGRRAINIETFVIFIGLLVTGCSVDPYSHSAVADGVSLAVMGQEGNKVRLKLRNNRATPIFVNYRRDENSGGPNVMYRLVCHQADRETDFGPSYHNGEPFTPLESGEELEFVTSRSVPSFKRNCYISIGYYNNVEAVELVRRLAENVDEYVVSEEQIEFLEQSTEKIIVTLNINSDGNPVSVRTRAGERE